MLSRHNFFRFWQGVVWNAISYIHAKKLKKARNFTHPPPSTGKSTFLREKIVWNLGQDWGKKVFFGKPKIYSKIGAKNPTFVPFYPKMPPKSPKKNYFRTKKKWKKGKKFPTHPACISEIAFQTTPCLFLFLFSTFQIWSRCDGW